jgi:hypothetical protein
MAKRKEPLNPFYVLSGVFGAAFTLTACAFGVLMLRSTRPAYGNQPEHPLMNLLDRHGLAILGVEVVLLGIFSVAAIVLDHFRNKRLARQMREQRGELPPATSTNQAPDH